MLDIHAARSICEIARAFAGRTLPPWILDALAEAQNDALLPFGLRRECTYLLRRAEREECAQ